MTELSPEGREKLALLQAENDFQFIQALIDIRVASGKSIEDVAEKCGVSADTIKELETKRNPHLSTLRRYMMVLDVTQTIEVIPFEE